MSQRLIKPGMRPASLAGRVHPRTGVPLEPVGHLADGTPLWPVLGGDDNDDPNDPRFTGEGGRHASDDDDDEDDEEDDGDDDEEDEKPRRKNKSKKDDDDDDEEDNPRLARASRQAAKYRKELRAEQARNRELAERVKAIENKDRKPEEVASEELTKARSDVDSLTKTNRELTLKLAVVTTPLPGKEWVDIDDTLALAERLGYLDDVEVEDDGTVDRKSLRAALRELARNKPHLVKASGRGKSTKDDDSDEDTDDEPRSSAPSMNGKRKGGRGTTDRAALAKRFPVLGRS